MKRNLTIFFLCLFIIMFVSDLHAYNTSFTPEFTIYQDDGIVDGNLLRAEIGMSTITVPGGIAPNSFLLTLTNVSLLDPNHFTFDYPAVVLLTGFGFRLDGLNEGLPDDIDITGGLVSTDNLRGDGDPSDQWGYDNDRISSGYFQQYPDFYVDTVVSTMTSAAEWTFNGDLVQGDLLDGPDYGVLSNAYLVAGDPIQNINQPYFVPSVLIQVNLSTDIGATDDDWESFFNKIIAGDTVVAFGSPNVIPEPATMLLLGTGLLGMALIGRTRFRKVNKKS